MNSDIFRFMTIRPAMPADPSQCIILADPGNMTPFHTKVAQAWANNDRAQMIAATNGYISSANFVSSMSTLATIFGNTQFGDFDRWLTKNPDPTLNRLKTAVKQIFGQDAGQVVADPKFPVAKTRVADSLLAVSVVSTGQLMTREYLIRTLRQLDLLERVAANDPLIQTSTDIAKALRKTICLPGNVFPLPAPQPLAGPAPAPIGPAPTSKEKELSDRESSLEELLAIKLKNFPRRATYRGPVVQSQAPPRSMSLFGRGASNRPAREAVPTMPTQDVRRWLIQRGTLSQATQTVLTKLEVRDNDISLTDAVVVLENAVEQAGKGIVRQRKWPRLVRIGNSYINVDQLPDEPGPGGVTLPTGSGTMRPIGVGELRVVRQKIIKYEEGEVAHIENVLRGEEKERKHRRTKKTEEITFVAIEREEEAETDLQTTERFELQRETASTIQEDMSLSGGLTVSSYGTTVEVTANVEASYNRSSEESERVASGYARDVVSRSVSRVQERIREERTRRVVEEIEEINTHILKNVLGKDHIIGIYRWVDKIYEVELRTYDDRTMFEFIIPEPASFLLYAAKVVPPVGSTLEEPRPPVFPFDSEIPLLPGNISRSNYQQWVAQYQATGVKPPPSQYQLATWTWETQEQPQGWNSRRLVEQKADKIKIPTGYYPVRAFANVAIYPNSECIGHAQLTVGRSVLRETGYDWNAEFEVTLDEEASEEEVVATAALQAGGEAGAEEALAKSGLPVSVFVSHSLGATVTIEVLCELTAAGRSKWQFQTYASIIEAYNNLKSQYDEQLRAAVVGEGIAIAGRNPLLNREVERTELKKAAISILTAQHFDLFGAIRPGADPLRYPEIDFTEAQEEGAYLQFFEQAFEWSQITYVFYPYFWARKKRWPMIQQIQDPDPLYEKFLKAGAARVLVSVRPGFEGAVTHFLDTGSVWGGHGTPDLASPLFVDIVEEIKAQQDAAVKDAPVKDQWEVKVPTSLVYLQKDDKLPDFTSP